MKRVILDTNILVSMVLGGEVGSINDEWKSEKFLLIVSDEVVSEITFETAHDSDYCGARLSQSGICIASGTDIQHPTRPQRR